jgi:hypothetical protein
MTLLSRDEWIRFRYDVKNSRRFIFGSYLLEPRITSSKYLSTEEFLHELILLSSNRLLMLQKDTPLWRAQLGGTPYKPPKDTWVASDGSETKIEGLTHRDFLKPHDCERMTPYRDKAKEGRVNPKGIPCLYTATTPNIALSEMKPTAGSYLTLARFVTVRDLKIVDLASDPIELAKRADGPTDEEMDSMVWEDLNDAFSEPVTGSDNIADYAATQIVAELFRRTGFDGIRYKSKIVEFESLEPSGSPERERDYTDAKSAQGNNDGGRNIALFDLTSTTFRSSNLYKFAIDARGAFSFRRVNEGGLCSDQKPKMDS